MKSIYFLIAGRALKTVEGVHGIRPLTPDLLLILPFIRKLMYKVNWMENLPVYQKSLGAFFQAQGPSVRLKRY